MFIMALFQPYPRKYVNTIFPPCSISHLVDVAYLKVEQALELHHRLQLLPICQHLYIIHIGNEYTFICHRRLLELHVANYDGHPPYYVCIDETLQSPSLQEFCPPLTQMIRNKLKPVLSRPDNIFIINSIPSCMISLTGWLLEYPVVYIQTTENEEDASTAWRPASGNALSGVPLTVFTVVIRFGQERIHNHRMLSFSYPTMLFTESQAQTMQTNMSSMIQRRCEFWSSDIYFEIMITHESLDRVAM
ncbi:hypothetical protein BGW37DRAFT_479529 [Umbelopsis sp. PMI_123]|nr:hypothetical protein BGW37DRAFT_479529 [Umbelopsis sp. PMI_123]